MPVLTSPLWKKTAVAKVVSRESCMCTLPWFCSIGGSPPRDRLLHVAVGMALVVSVGSLFAVAPLIDIARDAADALPF